MSTKSLLKFLTGASIAGTLVGGYVLLRDSGTRLVLYDENRQKKLYGHTIILTGGTNGIGKACAEELAARGAKLILPSKYVEKCEKVAKTIRDKTANMQVFCEKCDLADLDSIRQFVDKVKREQRRVDVLINNAAVLGPKSTRQVSLQNTEMHLTVNFLAPYLLTNLLLSRTDAASPSPTDAETSGDQSMPTYSFANELKVRTVINLVCDVRRFMKLARHKPDLLTLDFHDFNVESEPFDSAVSYTKSKLALMVWTQALANTTVQPAPSGGPRRPQLQVLAVDPGVVRSELMRNAGYRKNLVSYAIVSLFERLTLRRSDDCLPTILYAILEDDTCRSHLERDRAAAGGNVNVGGNGNEKDQQPTQQTARHSTLWMSALRNPDDFAPVTSLLPPDTAATVTPTMVRQLELTAAAWTRLHDSS